MQKYKTNTNTMRMGKQSYYLLIFYPNLDTITET